jgi:adenylate cyclase
MFVDLAEFTTLSEDLAPASVVATLNEYFAGAAEIIERHKGIITQFQGDAILAVYKVPIADPDHAQNAVQSALEIRRFVNGRRFDDRRLRCRIGINTGEIVAGNVGAPARLSYTVHGDTVNVAARLEQMNKMLGTELLIAASTAERLDGYEFEKIGVTRVRGKAHRVRLFTIR